jgi:hypothetical protein
MPPTKSREKCLAFSGWADSAARMIQSGFLSEEDRKALTALARDASSPCRVTRRANGLVAGNRANPDDRGRNRRRHLDDKAPGIQFLGTLLRKKSSMASANCPHTTRAIIMPSSCGNGSPGRGAGSSCISYRPIAPTLTRSSGYGASCTGMSRTTNATPQKRFRDSVTDNFRVISPKDFRVLT